MPISVSCYRLAVSWDDYNVVYYWGTPTFAEVVEDFERLIPKWFTPHTIGCGEAIDRAKVLFDWKNKLDDLYNSETSVSISVGGAKGSIHFHRIYFKDRKGLPDDTEKEDN